MTNDHEDKTDVDWQADLRPIQRVNWSAALGTAGAVLLCTFALALRRLLHFPLRAARGVGPPWAVLLFDGSLVFVLAKAAPMCCVMQEYFTPVPESVMLGQP